MARNGSGTYSLPAGNPVVAGTTITPTWANDTLSDIATELSDSVSRSGKGPMLAAFKAVDGAVGAPGVAFNSEATSGLYRAGAGDVRIAILGSDVLQVTASGLVISGSLAYTDPARAAFPLGTGWANGTFAPTYYKTASRVYLAGSVSITFGAGQAIALSSVTMPAGFRPGGTVGFPLETAGSPLASGQKGRLTITSAGAIQIERLDTAAGATAFHLDGISYFADN